MKKAKSLLAMALFRQIKDKAKSPGLKGVWKNYLRIGSVIQGWVYGC